MTQIYQSGYERTFPWSDTSPQLALAANTGLTYTVPGNNTTRYRITFSFGANSNVWVGINETAVVPTPGTISPNNRTQLNPRDAYYVKGGDVISFISDTIVTNAGFSLLQLPN